MVSSRMTRQETIQTAVTKDNSIVKAKDMVLVSLLSKLELLIMESTGRTSIRARE